jgi:hypothetical protein
MRRLVLLSLAAFALLVAPAWAQDGAAAATPTVPTPTVPTPAPKPKPKPKPKGGKLSLSWIQPVRLHGTPLALVGRSLLVRGRMSTYVRGQRATIRAYRNGRLFFKKTVAIRGVGHGRGGFRLRVTPKGAGKIGVTATHKATAAQKGSKARPLRLNAHQPYARYGQRGTVVRLLQDRLGREHYAVSRSGWFDGSTSRALIAFRKVNRMARNGTLDRTILHMLLANKGQFRARFPGHGRHVEGDIGRQVLALINPGGKVFRVYHMSSGKPSTPTVLGSFRFYRKDYGTNAHGMVHSSYFIRGYAIHGYASVPVFNASHGCLRVPIPSAYSIFRQVRIGERIDVYR